MDEQNKTDMNEKSNLNLADFTLPELVEWLSANKVADAERNAYRGRQVFKWFGLGAASFREMTNLPAEMRAELSARATTGIPSIIGEMRSARDKVVKYAMKTGDGNIVETVLLPYKQWHSVCVSSQAGCKMGCAFCASKPSGFRRNLTPGEMLGQVAAVSARGAVKIDNVVVMGVGEPFDNYDNTLKFIRLLHEHDDTNIGYRKITVSTCGILPGILRLADEGLPVGLSVSLNASNDRARDLLMPVNRRYSIDKILEGCNIYTYKTNRRVTFEYALIEGVNDAPDDARELARRIRGMLCHVNVIPVNRTGAAEFKSPPNDRVKRFAEIVGGGGVQATVRRSLGSDIAAACGQLRNSLLQDKDA